MTDAWRDIETAPKDGTELWLWDPRLRRARVGSWREDGMASDMGAMWLDDGFESCPLEPTHWMPLPEPPSPPTIPATDTADDDGLYGRFHVMLLDLLAVIHRDGGHKVHEIGIQLAWEQAMELSSERIAAFADGIEAAAKACEAALREHCDKYGPSGGNWSISHTLAATLPAIRALAPGEQQ